MSMKKLIFMLIFPLFLFFGLLSCSTKIESVVRVGGSANVSLQASLEPRTLALLKSLMGFMGEASDAPVLNGEAISQSMASAPGISSVLLRNTNSSALEGTIAISHVGNFLSSEEGKFITYSEESGITSIVFVLDRDSAPLLISKLSAQVEEYLSALMAPIVSGESLNPQEYLNLVALIYSRPLADEIAASHILASIDFPRPLIEVQGGTFTGRRAEFEIPLLDILVLEKPLRYELKW